MRVAAWAGRGSCARRGRAAARSEPRRHGDQRRHGAGEGRGQEAARTGREDRRSIARRRHDRPRSTSPAPGFINLTLKPHVWGEELRVVLAAGKEYGRSDIGDGEKVNVEYVSANPTGPMHVGHGRGAVFGDALANLLAFAGFDVTREYYINDAGAQVDVLGALGVPALPRGARRRHRHSGGTLSGRLSQAGRRRARGRVWHEAQGDERGRMAADRARQGRRHDDGHDPRRSRRAQCAPRRVLFRTLADRRRQGPGRRHHRSVAGKRRGLRRPAAAAEGWQSRGLGRPRADVVPLDRFRRRRRPAAEEVGRQLHLFRLRHRLSQIEIRSRLSQP